MQVFKRSIGLRPGPYWFRQGCLKKFVANETAPIEHLFNNDIYCDSSWCWSREIENKVHEIISMRNKNKVRKKTIQTDDEHSFSLTIRIICIIDILHDR